MQATKGRRLCGIAAVLLLAGALAGCGGAEKGSSAAAVQVAGSSFGGPFALTAPDGKTVSNATLKGRPYVIFFGFTRCPDVCPTTLARLAKLRKQLGPDGGKFDIVFVSVDPEHDTPADIGRYVALFGTPVIGLTGTKAQVDAAAKSFGVYYEKVPQPGGDYTIDHTASIYLMDRAGAFVTTIDHHEDDATALAKLGRIIG